MDAVEERKKRIEALKQRKAQLLAEGNLKKDNQSSTQTYLSCFDLYYFVAFVLEIIHLKMNH